MMVEQVILYFVIIIEVTNDFYYMSVLVFALFTGWNLQISFCISIII